MSASPNQVGTFNYVVANQSTNVLFDVAVTVEGDVQAGGRHIRSATSALSSQHSVNAFAYWFPKFTAEAVFHLVGSINNAGEGSFMASEQPAICTAFTGTLQFVEMAHELATEDPLSSMFDNLMQLLGHGPTAVFVFANGDVATYQIFPLLPGSTACKYDPGTARNALGQFINDRGMGGSGSSSGGNYVLAGSGGFSITLETYTVSCSYLEHPDGTRDLIGCVVEQ